MKEERIRSITKLYYSNPKVQEALFKFAKDREVVPRYFEGFGKRPDVLQYRGDIMNLVNKGATSFHASEELWNDALKINADMTQEELADARKGWDLLIDVDSPYLDCSKIAARLICDALEHFGIKNYGLKFSVVGNTPILIRNMINGKIRLVPINEVIESLKKGEKFEVLSLNRERKIVFSKIYNYLEHDEEVYEILHEQSKVPLMATKHHSVFIFNKGEIIEKKVSEIKRGDFFVTFNSKINPTMNVIKSIEYEFELGKNQYEKRTTFRKKIELSKDLMRLIGYYLSEGHVTNIINQVGFSFNRYEVEYIDDCVTLLKKVTNKHISIRHPNEGSTQILIHSKEWASFFEKFCGKSKNKHVPDFSWELSKELFLEMLMGYIRGDGYKVGKYTIVIKSVALQLIKELVWLCKLNGISCSLSNEKSKPHKLPQGNMFKGSFVYILKIPKSELDIDEFRKERNKFSPHPRDRTFPIDGLKQVYLQIKPKMFNYHRVEQMTLKKKRANLSRIKKVIEWFKSFGDREFDDESKKIINNYESLFNSDVGVLEVKSIKKLKEEKVYDVSVEDTEAFFGNDYPILLHNSGSKGFHIVLSGNAFPESYDGKETRRMFPDWPRAISEFLMDYIRREYNKQASEILTNLEAIKERTKLEEELFELYCTNCNRPAVKGAILRFKCDRCGNEVERRNVKMTARKLRCLDDTCPGYLDVVEEKKYYYCENCKDPRNPGKELDSIRNPEYFEEMESAQASKIANLDLVLVAPRHLFRMPYSLHEKTALASVVLFRDELDSFSPKEANPLKIEIRDYYPENEAGEASGLLKSALEWKKMHEKQEDEIVKRKYYEDVKIENVSEDDFPEPIKKLLAGGLADGKKRGLFVLITFLKSCGFNADYINKKIREWNETNKPPLKEGYVKSQIEWHLKQRKKILPPNYDNNSFYKDLGLLDGKQSVKNPIVEVLRKIKNRD